MIGFVREHLHVHAREGGPVVLTVYLHWMQKDILNNTESAWSANKMASQ